MEDKILVFEDLRKESVAEFRKRTWESPFDVPTNVQYVVRAYVNHGRWVVDCPNPPCGGAELASKLDPTFICNSCGSLENGGLLYEVIFPRDADAVEAALMRRPLTHMEKPNEAGNRNWYPWESVDDLNRENVEHGLD